MIPEKSRRISAPTIKLLRKYVEADKPIYKITSEQANRLINLGAIVRPDPNGPYHLTEQARTILMGYDAQTVRPKRINATDKVIAFVQALPFPGISRDAIVEHLEKETERGISTSRKFTQRNKGRRHPRDKGKA